MFIFSMITAAMRNLRSWFSSSLYAEDIPRAAAIKRYIRLRNGDQVTEWLPNGNAVTLGGVKLLV